MGPFPGGTPHPGVNAPEGVEALVWGPGCFFDLVVSLMCILNLCTLVLDTLDMILSDRFAEQTREGESARLVVVKGGGEGSIISQKVSDSGQ